MGVIASDELRAWFDAILAAPDDDAPRLELARFLTDRGDERGAYIRLSCELDRLERDDPARAALEARCAQLPSFWFFTDTSYDFPHGKHRRRGFVDEISCSPPDFVAHADALMRDAPIRVYDVHNGYGHGALLAHCVALGKLRCLKLVSASTEDRAAILGSPYLVALRELTLPVQLDHPRAVEQLADDTRGLRGLRVLRLEGTIMSQACDALAELAAERGLELLDVTSAVVLPLGSVAQLRAKLGEDRVLPRPVPRFSYRFGVLDLSAAQLSAGEIRALIDRGEYRSAHKLVLTNNRIGDHGVAHLARSGAFPSLTELQLADTRLTDAGARLLAHQAVGLEHLEHLELGDVPAEGSDIGARDKSGVSDAVVRELARSPRLPALRSITRGKEYRHRIDGREGREVVPIQRDDGRVVESIILHTMWP
jgi:uncharacterized protein (TIGR02996 family)